MAGKLSFRTLLSLAEGVLAAFFGGIGVWQRNVILSQPFIENQTLADTTARYHVCPWPLKFAIVSNLPSFLAYDLVMWPIYLVLPDIPDSLQLALALLFVLTLWYLVGLRLDRKWTVRGKPPWVALLIFTLACFLGVFLPLGYTGYVLYGLLVWLVTALALFRSTNRATLISAGKC